MDKQEKIQALFKVFNEIGIIYQLSVTMFNRRLPEGMHVSHFSVIHHLCRLGDGRTPLQLANAFQVTKATMTNTLIKLTEREFITVKANPEDGRSKLVYLTQKGWDFRDRAIASINPIFEQLGRDLNIDKLLTTLPELEELRLYLDKNRDV